MSKRISTALAVLGTVGLLSGCGTQPSAGCIVQDSTFGNWQAKYTLTNGATGSCGALKGDVWGVWKYVEPNAADKGIPANKAATLAIRPRAAATLMASTFTDTDGKSKTVVRADKTKATNLSDTFTAEPDAEGFCTAAGFPTQVIDAIAVNNARGETVVPARRVEYTFKDVQVYASPSAPGTQIRGTLTYTDAACTAEYEVWALWPYAPCVPGATDPVDNCGEGSGLNPDFKVVCDADLKACVPAQKPPSFNVQL